MPFTHACQIWNATGFWGPGGPGKLFGPDCAEKVLSISGYGSPSPKHAIGTTVGGFTEENHKGPEPAVSTSQQFKEAFDALATGWRYFKAKDHPLVAALLSELGEEVTVSDDTEWKSYVMMVDGKATFEALADCVEGVYREGELIDSQDAPPCPVEKGTSLQITNAWWPDDYVPCCARCGSTSFTTTAWVGAEGAEIIDAEDGDSFTGWNECHECQAGVEIKWTA